MNERGASAAACGRARERRGVGQAPEGVWELHRRVQECRRRPGARGAVLLGKGTRHAEEDPFGGLARAGWGRRPRGRRGAQADAENAAQRPTEFCEKVCWQREAPGACKDGQAAMAIPQ